MNNIDPALLQRIVALLQQNGAGGVPGLPAGAMPNSAVMPPMAPHPSAIPGPGPAQLAPQGPHPMGPMMNHPPVDPRQFGMPGPRY